jgi:ubiquinone/menaquinone biosynthesis C-methylase UbiE
MPRYSTEPPDAAAFRTQYDRFYTRSARLYDVLVKKLPFWKTWLCRALPALKGPRVLEVSFGTGYLLTKYADRFEVHGIDLNQRMVEVASANLDRAGLHAELRQGDVEALPYPDATFDTVLCTMAFTAYPDGHAALAEMLRVLAPDGRLVLIDVNYPANGNHLGNWIVRGFKAGGDLIRDMDSLFAEFGLQVADHEIGGRGGIHLYVATRRGAADVGPTAPPADR